MSGAAIIPLMWSRALFTAIIIITDDGTLRWKTYANDLYLYKSRCLYSLYYMNDSKHWLQIKVVEQESIRVGSIGSLVGQSNAVLQNVLHFLVHSSACMSIVSASSTPHVLDMLPATGVRITIDHPTRNVQLDQLSTIVHDCVQTLVSALHSRASLLANCGQLNDAMSDAAATMSIAPTSPFGYLCAGRIFSYRGQHASAIKIYDDGLQHVPRLHDQYAQLLSAKAVSQQKINTRIDFFSWLPLEIVLSNLIPRIFDGQTVVDIGKEGRYLDVSRTWRERIAMADGFTFRVGTFPRSSSKGLSAKEYDQLLDMAPYIKSFAVWGLHEGIADHLTGGTTFTALKKLHVDGKERDTERIQSQHLIYLSRRSFTTTHQIATTFKCIGRINDTAHYGLWILMYI